MSNTILVSVVIPVHNVEDYIEECLNSILSQTYKMFEIILIDDGSKDRSREICEVYKKRYHQIKLITQTNGGLSCARNIGIKYAQGEYITFVDSDDVVSIDYLEQLVSLQKECGADLTSFPLASFSKDAQEINDSSSSNMKQVLTTEDALEKLCYGKEIDVTACSKLIKRQLLINHPFPVGAIYEDLAVMYLIINECKSIAVGVKKIYFYRQREGSIRHTQITSKHMQGTETAFEMMAFIETNYPKLKKAAVRRYISKCMGYLPMLAYYKDFSNLSIIIRKMRPFWCAIMTNQKIDLYFKVGFLISIVSPLTAFVVGKIRLKI